MAYQQHDQNSCCFSSLSSELKAPNQCSDANSITTGISSSLTDEIFGSLMFSNAILEDKQNKKGYQNLRYKLEQWKKIGTFDILNNISECLTLFHLIDSVGNAKHAVSVVGK